MRRTRTRRGRSGRGRPRPQPLDPSGRPKAVTLSITADDRTNSIIGMAPVEMAEGIRKVVALIEAKVQGDSKVTQLVASEGIDPAMLQEVMDAIQSRPATPTTPSRTNPLAPGGRAPRSGGR